MKNKSAKTVFNLTAEWVSNLVLIVTQTILIVVMSCFGHGRDATFWIIFGCIGASDLFFTFMLLYKVYRSRLTLVTLSKQELVFRRAYKKVHVAAEDLVVALCEGGKPGSVIRYAMIFDKNDPDGRFIFEVSGTKCLKRIAAYAPRILMNFVTSCTEGSILYKLREKADEELAGYIDRELEARAQKSTAPKSTSKKKKHKKKKK